MDLSDRTWKGEALLRDDLDKFLPSSPLENEPPSGISPYAYKAALDQIANIVCTDLDGYIVYANENFCKINKCTLDYVIGKKNSMFRSGRHGPDFYKKMWETLGRGEVWHGEILNRATDGSHYWVDTRIATRYDDYGEPVGYIALRVDITARKEAEARAAEESRKRRDAETLLNDIIETLPNGIVAYDKDGKVTFFNKAHSQIYEDVAPGIAIGRRRQDLVQDANREILAPTQGKATNNPLAHGESLIQHLPDDRWIQVQNRHSSSGTLVSVQTDVTELKRAEQQIAIQAERDSLTGVLNRSALVKRLSDAVRELEPCVLVLVDLDDFKAVNDGLGHLAGNELLCHVANCLQSSVRRIDTIARVGGDEFAIVLSGSHTRTEIRHVMDRLSAALATPACIGQRSIIPSASMGVASFPRDSENPDDLMKSADLALYQCKRAARGAYSIYNNSLRRQRMRRVKLTEKLKLALARNEFQVVLQPQRKMSDGCHTGFEALVRWNLGRKWVDPEELISVAEEAGLIWQLSHQIMDKALAMMARLKHAGLEPGTLALNVVAAQLHEPSFSKKLMRLLDAHGISPSEIEIEVTENVILDRSAEKIARVLEKLHARGVAIALDDFGMGYASLTHLKRFRLNRLKIDRSFISGMMDNQDDHVIVRTLISLAHNLGLEVVAEGIETAEQYEELLKLGCDSAQGYFFGRPMTERGAADYCRQNEPARSAANATPRLVSNRSTATRNGAPRAKAHQAINQQMKEPLIHAAAK